MAAGGFIAGSIIGKLILDKTGWNQSVKEVGKDTKTLSGHISQNSEKFKQFGRMISLAGASITASFGLLIKKTVDTGDKINDLSQKTGIATEILSGYKLAADKSGTSLEGLAIGMRGLANQMQAASAGSKEAQATFKSLGVEIVDSTGKLRPLNDVMLDVAERFAQMPDGAQKTATAMDVFGRAGMELIPMLNLGKKGLQENYEATKRLGGIWSKDAALAADKFNDSMAELQTATGALGREFVTALLPAIKSIVEAATGIISKFREWGQAHPELVGLISKLTLGVGALATVIGPVLIILPRLVQGFVLLKTAIAGVTVSMMASLGAWAAIIAAAGKAYEITNNLINSKKGLADAEMREMINLTSLQTKFTEAARAAGLHSKEIHALTEKYQGNIAALVMAIYKGKEGKELQEALAAASKKHADAIGEQKKKIEETNPAIGILNNLLSIAKQKTEEIKEATVDWINALPSLRSEISRTLVKFDEWLGVLPNLRNETGRLVETWQEGGGEMRQVTEETTSSISNAFDGLFNDIAAGFGNTFQQWMSGATTFRDFIKGIWDDIKNAFFRMIGQMVAEWIVNFAKKLIDSTVEIGTSLVKNIGGALGGLAKTAGSLASGLLSSLGSIGSIISGITSAISLLKGPQKQGDVTYWLKLIWENTQNLWNTMTWLPNTFDTMNQQLQTLKDIGWSLKPALTIRLDKANSYLKQIAQGIANLPSAQTGAFVAKDALVKVHAGEHIIPANFKGGSNIATNMNLNFHINAVDADGLKTVVVKKIIPIMTDVFRGNTNQLASKFKRELGIG